MVINDYREFVPRDGLLMKMPIPVPEPPRFVNSRPLVPDLSLCTDEERQSLSDARSSSPPPFGEAAQTRENGQHSGRAYANESCSCHHHNQFFAEILKAQEEQLENLTKQMAELLKINRAQLKKKKEPEKRSVATMTDQASEPVASEVIRKDWRRDRVLRKDGTNECCSSSDSDFHSRSLLLSFEKSSKDSDDEVVYDKILREVESRLSQSRSDLHYGRSRARLTSRYPSPQRGEPGFPRYPNRYSPSQESVIINQLAEKYLKDNYREKAG